MTYGSCFNQLSNSPRVGKLVMTYRPDHLRVFIGDGYDADDYLAFGAQLVDGFHNADARMRRRRSWAPSSLAS